MRRLSGAVFEVKTPSEEAAQEAEEAEEVAQEAAQETVAAPAPVAPAPAVPAAAPPPAVVSAPPPPAPVAEDRAGAAASSAVDSTAIVAALDEGITLPFEAVQVPEAPPPVADQLPPQTANIDETAALGVKLDLGDVLPFDRAQPASPSHGFTIEQYASLCAERDLVGQTNVGRVLQRYGLPDHAALQALDASWSARLGDPATRARFDQLRARYRQWLEQPRRG